MKAEDITIKNGKTAVKYKGNEIMELLVLSIFVIMAQIADARSSEVLQWMCSLGILVVFFISHKKQEMPILLFLIFNNKSLSIAGVSCALLMVVASVSKDIIFRNIKFKKKELMFFVSFLLIGLVLIIEGRSEDFIFLIKYWFTIVFIIKNFNGKNDKTWYEQCLKYMFVGFVITIMSSFLFNRALLDETRYTVSSDANTNMTAIFCGWIFAYSAIMVLDKKVSKIIKIYALLGFSFSLIVGILTASRTFLLMVAISSIIVFLTSTFMTRHFLRNGMIIFLICVVCVMLITYNEALNEEFMYLMRRVLNPRGNDISGGRLTIWANYFDVISSNGKNVLLGFKPLDYGIKESAHNAIIEQFVQYGIIGNVFIVAFSYYAFKIMKQNLCLHCYKGHLAAEQNMHLLPGFTILVSGMVSHNLMALPKTIFIYFALYLYLSHKNSQQCKIRR